ncbi:MAG: flagellar biosynthetic protein FliR [Buchnera aphidicola (Schlechtendalia peitan)]
MITFNINDLTSIFYNFLFISIRIISFIVVAPLLGDKSISKKIKLLFSFVISWFFMFFLPIIQINLFSIDGFLILIEQILIGICLGFSMQLVFSVIKLTGEIISFQMGLSFSSLLDWNTRSNTSVLSRFFYIFLLLFFLESNGHIWEISVILDTFYKIPIKKIELDSNVFLNIVTYSKFIFVSSFMIMFPIIIVQLFLNISMGILNRISSQISIFSIGFTITLIVGMYTLFLFIPMIPYVYNNIFNHLIYLLSILVKI